MQRFVAVFNLKRKTGLSYKQQFFLQLISINIPSSDNVSFIRMLQELEEAMPLYLVPHWAYIPSSSWLRLPTYNNSHR